MSSAWLGPDETAAVAAYLEDRFGIPADRLDGHRLLLRGQHVYAVSRAAADAWDALQGGAAGVRILTVMGPGRFKLATRGAQFLGRWAVRNRCEVDDDGLRALVQGRSLPWTGPERGFVVLAWEGIPVGVGLVRAGRLVSQLPRAVTEHLRCGADDVLW